MTVRVNFHGSYRLARFFPENSASVVLESTDGNSITLYHRENPELGWELFDMLRDGQTCLDTIDGPLITLEELHEREGNNIQAFVDALRAKTCAKPCDDCDGTGLEHRGEIMIDEPCDTCAGDGTSVEEVA